MTPFQRIIVLAADRAAGDNAAMDANTPHDPRFGALRLALESLLRRAAAQRWVLLAASLIAAGAALWSAVAPVTIALLWAVIVAAAFLSARSRHRHLAARAAPARQALDAPPAARAIAATLPDPCLLLTADARLAYQNPSAHEIFGPIPQGQSVTAILRAPDIAEAIREVRASGTPGTVMHYERIPVERRFEAHIAPIPGNGGEGGIVIVLRDLTEQQRLERMRADFVANASHELRTPLASLSSFIETLQGAAKDDTKAREKFLGIMRDQAQRMSRLISDLLSLSRIELNAHVRPAARVDVAAVVARVVEALHPLAEQGGVDLTFTAPAAAPVVTGERDELAQVFQNLIENAIKYGESGKRVDVRVDTLEDGGETRARVSVRDYGPGIAEEHIPRLTERFYRVDVASSREKGGTGLGLAIVKHILNRHRGTLKVTSKPGEGAEFSVILPRAPEHDENRDGAAEDTAGAPDTGEISKT